MAPAPSSSQTAGTSLNTDTIGAIVGIAIGSAILLSLVAALAVVFIRKRRPPLPLMPTADHKRTTSDAIVATPLLLHPQPWAFEEDWKGKENLVIPNRHYPSEIRELRGHLSPSLFNEKPVEDLVLVTPGSANSSFTDKTTPVPKPHLSRLKIPRPLSHNSYTPVKLSVPAEREHPDNPVYTPVSADSASIYSQPSGEGGPSSYTYPLSAPPNLPVVDETSTQPIERTNTYFIGRILKNRANRHLQSQPISRSVSHIERKGSIQSFIENSSRRSLHSKPTKKTPPAHRMSSLPESESPSSPVLDVTPAPLPLPLPLPLPSPSPSPPQQVPLSLAGPSTVSLPSFPPSPNTISTTHILNQFPFPPPPEIPRATSSYGPPADAANFQEVVPWPGNFPTSDTIIPAPTHTGSRLTVVLQDSQINVPAPPRKLRRSHRLDPRRDSTIAPSAYPHYHKTRSISQERRSIAVPPSPVDVAPIRSSGQLEP